MEPLADGAVRTADMTSARHGVDGQEQLRARFDVGIAILQDNGTCLDLFVLADGVVRSLERKAPICNLFKRVKRELYMANAFD